MRQPLFAKAGFPFSYARADSRQAGMTGFGRCAVRFPTSWNDGNYAPRCSGRILAAAFRSVGTGRYDPVFGCLASGGDFPGKFSTGNAHVFHRPKNMRLGKNRKRQSDKN